MRKRQFFSTRPDGFGLWLAFDVPSPRGIKTKFGLFVDVDNVGVARGPVPQYIRLGEGDNAVIRYGHLPPSLRDVYPRRVKTDA